MDPELKAILDQLASATGPAAESVERLGKAFSDGVPEIEHANDGLNLFGKRLKDNTKKTKDSLEKLTTGFKTASSSIKSGLKSLGDESESGAKSIKNITDSVGGAISGFTSQFGMIGGVIGGAATAITGMAGVALGFVDQLSSTNKMLAETGILLGDTFGQGSGIDEFDAMVRSAGLSASMLTKVIEQSNESLRLFSGGAGNGLRKITDGFTKLKKANDGQLESLYKLGFSTEDVMAGMADFGATAKLAGKDLDTKQLAEGTAKYLTMQRELTRLTGTSVKDAKAKAEQLTREAAFQSYLKKLAPDTANAVKQLLSSLPESQRELAKAAMMGYEVLDPALAFVKAQVPDFVKSFRDIGVMAENSALNMENVDEVTAQSQITAQQAFERVRDQLGDSQMLGQYAQAGGTIGQIVTILGDTIADVRANAEAAKNTKDSATEVATGVGKIATVLPDVEKASIALRSALYTIGSALTATFAPLIGGLASMVDGGASALQQGLETYTKGMNEAAVISQEAVGRANSKFKDENERQAAYAKKLADTFSSFGQGNMFEGLFTKLGDTISKAITDGFAGAVNEILPGVGATASDQKKLIDELAKGKSVDELIAKYPEKMDDLIAALRDETREKQIEDGGWTGAGAFLTKYSGLGYAGDAVEDLVGTGRNNFTADEIVKAYNAINGTDIKVPQKAFGDILNPTPGGHVVRVAEAGQPEIIAPAKRGSDGKLGLEVTGAMLDNSQLLKTLVDVNKNQASMMSGLKGKMEEMNNTLDKLVYEQRQANRLAI